jgi:DNA-binding FrmR family transcriptional regulator
MNGAGATGINRTGWDLHYDPPKLVELRTTPEDNPHIWEEPRFQGKDSRPITHWGAAEAEVGPVAAPGKYTAKLTVDGETYAQPLEIIRDPHSTGSEADLKAAVSLQLRVRDDISHTSDMINKLEWMRKQLEDVQKMLQSQKDNPELLKQVVALDQKMQKVEYQLVSKALTTSDDK